MEVYKFYLYMPYEYFLIKNSSNLIRNTINEINTYVGNVIGSLIVILSEGVLFLGLITWSLIYEPFITLFIL